MKYNFPHLKYKKKLKEDLMYFLIYLFVMVMSMSQLIYLALLIHSGTSVTYTGRDLDHIGLSLFFIILLM